MRCLSLPVLLPLILLTCVGSYPAQAPNDPKRSPEDRLLDQAAPLLIGGQADEAIKLATQAIQLNTNHLRSWFMRGRFYQETDQPHKAIADFRQVVRLDSNNVAVWSQLGTEYFVLGDFKKSLDCFDRFLKSMPQEAPGFWQRGVVAYEAGQYGVALKQFQQYRQLDTNDVEATVWQFLCVAKTKGVERARLSLAPVTNDPRVPMMQIHRMFAGQIDPAEVLRVAAIDTTQPSDNAEQKLNTQMFYAHLYVGLYEEALGKLSLAAEHLGQAAMIYHVKGFLGEFARLHAAELREKANESDSVND